MGGGNPQPGMGGAPPGGQAVSTSSLEPIDTIYLKLRAKNIVNPKPRDSLNREYSQLLEKLFRGHEMFSNSETDTKVTAGGFNIDPSVKWFDFVLQLKLTSPIIMKDPELD